MKRFLVTVSVLGVLFIGVALAATSVNSDWININTGSKTGKYTKTKTPVNSFILLNGTDTTGAASNIVSGEALIEFVPAAATGESSYIKIIGKDNKAVRADNTTSTFTLYLSTAGNSCGYAALAGTATTAGYATLTATASTCTGNAATANYATLTGTSSTCTGNSTTASYASLTATSSACVGGITSATFTFVGSTETMILTVEGGVVKGLTKF